MPLASASRDWLEQPAKAGAGDFDYAVIATITVDGPGARHDPAFVAGTEWRTLSSAATRHTQRRCDMAGRLSSSRVGVLLAEGFEDLEFWVTVMRMQEEDA